MKIHMNATLVLFIFVVFQADNVSTEAEGYPSFTTQFLGRDIHFQLDPHFSAHRIADEFCKFEGLEPHLRAVRELIENTVADALSSERIEDALAGKDAHARLFVEATCRDFPALHAMQSHFTLRSSPRFIIDAFPFFNELEGRFLPFVDKIVHVVLDTLPESPDHWVRERAQRDAIHEGLAQSGGYTPPLQLRSTFFYYSLQHRWTEIQDGMRVPFQVVYHASWHLSFFGGEERIRTKILSYAHQENNRPENINSEHIQSAIREGKDLFGRGKPHGELLPSTEPYDIPSPILSDVAHRGTESKYAEWLAEEFQVAEFVEGWAVPAPAGGGEGGGGGGPEGGDGGTRDEL